jgi:hypothetical protein
MSVSHGAIPAMSRMDGHASDPSFQPIIQVINIKAVGAQGGTDRYRVSAMEKSTKCDGEEHQVRWRRAPSAMEKSTKCAVP